MERTWTFVALGALDVWKYQVVVVLCSKAVSGPHSTNPGTAASSNSSKRKELAGADLQHLLWTAIHVVHYQDAITVASKQSYAKPGLLLKGHSEELPKYLAWICIQFI